MNDKHQLNNCLFFSSCKLSREAGRIADKEFKSTGLPPSHAFLISIVNHEEGIHQKKLGELLHITPSTMTRFIEKLAEKDLVKPVSEGKSVYIYSTEKGRSLQKEIDLARERLCSIYSKALTAEEKDTLHNLLAKLLDSFSS